MKKENNDVWEKMIDVDYFKLNDEEKDQLCKEVMSAIYNTVMRANVKGSKIEIINRIVSSTIEDHLKLENYEIVQILTDVKKKLDEAGNK